MRRNEPSFYRLFRRGHYVHAPVAQLDDEAELEGQNKERQEKERFAVASLAFCLRHDRNFRREFWERICRVPDDPTEMPPIEAEGILLEPPRWADLRLVSDKGGARFVWVVEVKAGSPLEPKQNPTRPEFTTPSVGYGAQFKEEEGKLGTRMRYIILGANPVQAISKGQTELGIAVQARLWNDLQGMKRDRIVGDFFELLAELQINPFFMDKVKEKVKDITVASGLDRACEAYLVLDAVCNQHEIKPDRYQFIPDRYDAADGGGGNMGTYLRHPSKKGHRPGFLLDLQKVTTKNEWWISWFGYHYDSDDHVTAKQVLFYVDDTEQQEALLRRLQGTFRKARSGRDGTALTVEVTSPPEPSTKDFDWFESVFVEAVRQ